MTKPEFYICRHCENIIESIQRPGPVPICCGESMEELVAGAVDAAVEKHVPVVTTDAGKLAATVGSVEHPMEADHYIQWIYVELADGSLRKDLKPGDAPAATFALLADDKPVAVYEYCNKHGLWKVDL